MVFKIPSLLHFLLLQFLCSSLCSRIWPNDDCQNIGLCRQAIEVYTKKNRCKTLILQRLSNFWRLKWLPLWSPFEAYLRRERDSNPRYPLGVYTLSRRASSTTRASFLVSPNVYSLYVGLKLVCKNRTLVLQ